MPVSHFSPGAAAEQVLFGWAEGTGESSGATAEASTVAFGEHVTANGVAELATGTSTVETLFTGPSTLAADEPPVIVAFGSELVTGTVTAADGTDELVTGTTVMAAVGTDEPATGTATVMASDEPIITVTAADGTDELVTGTTVMAAVGTDEPATGTATVMASDEPIITGTSTLAAEPEPEPVTGTTATTAVDVPPGLVPSLPVSAVADNGDPIHLQLVPHSQLPLDMVIIALNLSVVQCPRFNMTPPSPVHVAHLHLASLKWDFQERVEMALRYAEFSIRTMDHIKSSFVDGLSLSLMLHHTVSICFVWCTPHRVMYGPASLAKVLCTADLLYP
jgi:X-X-X-Leu-X-X-Gly heptad repeat protein